MSRWRKLLPDKMPRALTEDPTTSRKGTALPCKRQLGGPLHGIRCAHALVRIASAGSVNARRREEAGLFAQRGVRFGGEERHRQHHNLIGDDARGHEGGFRPPVGASF